MYQYNPLVAPDSEEWLGLSEGDRIDSVRSFHEHSDGSDFEDDQALSIHCAIHVVVENQLALKVEHLPETLSKLKRQGLDRHEAIHAIGAILSEEIFKIYRGETSEFSTSLYRRKLEKVTAKRWKKGQY
ncbi:hypothetical protein QWI17_10805 [Gilvimarinus sp. SDUM040013]|uniref:DUF1841 family protein n=1 Tax=Gilvimarinus gilvus TaxID=3058038 RepID=A0ABU4S3X2_9GAMM|nr:hypothetical protein [Gilvimarinus sp. SDUM040013]MDO3386328.1 hypothetical protein [Gilvimarinus sp. SDUM040013]MDX6850014.1 hypothetical protein [Gilvimarinus sp. SDUM040013]